jgi:hypothetical protein
LRGALVPSSAPPALVAVASRLPAAAQAARRFASIFAARIARVNELHHMLTT